MLLKRQSLIVNIGLLAGVIGIPYIALWAWLLDTGRIDSTILAVVAILLTIDAVLLWIFLKGLLRPLHQVSSALDQVARGDYTVTLDNPYQGEIGAMLNDVNNAVDTSRRLMDKILHNTVNIASASFESVSGSAQVVYNAEEEERYAHSISGAGDQISEAVSEIARSAETAASATQEASDAVGHGDVIVRETVTSMDALSGSVSEAARSVETLGESSRRIGEISAVISAIAEQTNLLALNAAIEAARAGEHGRGFAVVADEVRSLAERTSSATAEIAETITGIRGEIEAAVSTITASRERADTTREATHRTGEAFEAIRHSIETVGTLVEQIASAAEQQRVGTSEIANNIRRIAELAAGNTRSAHQAVDTVETMNDVIADQLKIFESFEIPKKAITVAKSDHMMWKKRLTELLLGRSSITLDEVKDHRQCRFGQWYYGEGKSTYGGRPEFTAIEAPHAKVHAIAREVVAHFNAGNKEEARRVLEGLDQPTREVLEALDRLKAAT